MSTELLRRAALGSLTVALAALAGCPGTLADPAIFEDAGGGRDAGRDVAAPCPDVVTTVFTPKCARDGCHNTGTKAGSLDLQAPDIYMRLDGKAASGGPGKLIDPHGDPEKSILYLKLLNPPPFGSQMPLIGAKLDPATVACVGSWIHDGGVSGSGDAGKGDAGKGKDAAASHKQAWFSPPSASSEAPVAILERVPSESRGTGTGLSVTLRAP